jgi:GNAT superfamily N-acetyltransferase
LSVPLVKQALLDRIDRFGVQSWRQNQVRQFEILENTQPGYHLFIAALDRTPAAVGSLNIRDGIGSLVAAATLPAFRRQVCQAALLQWRLDEARAAGCDLIVGNAALFSPSQRNLERAGLRPVFFDLSLSDCAPL